jgi:hypothetical protein
VRLPDADPVALHLTASLGLALVPARGRVAEEAEDLLRDSGAALGQAKALGRDRLELFDQRLRHEAVGRSKVEAALRARSGTGKGSPSTTSPSSTWIPGRRRSSGSVPRTGRRSAPTR